MNASRWAPGLRALMAPALTPPTTSLTALARRTPALQQAHPAPSRPFTTTHIHHRMPTKSGGSGGRPQRPAPRSDTTPPNLHVQAPTIMIAEPGRGLTGPHTTSRVLRSIDRKTQSLRVVAEGENGVPVCKIVDLQHEAQVQADRAEREKEREKKRQRYKILEISWSIARNDLAMKMERMQRFIGDGSRVELVLLRRKGAKKVTTEECEELLEKVRETIAGVEGAKEARKPDGIVGRTLKLFVENAGKGKGGEKKGGGEKGGEKKSAAEKEAVKEGEKAGEASESS